MSHGATAPSPQRVVLKGLLLIATLTAAAWGVEASGLLTINEAWIDSRIRGQGFDGELLYLGVATAAVCLAMPRQVIGFLGGYAFGVGVGTGLAWLSTVLACGLSFFYARLFARDLVLHRFGRRLRRMDAFLADNPFTTTLLIRLLPAGNNLATNLVGGVSSVRPLPFVAGSAVGYVPQTVIFALLGSGVRIDAELRVAVSVGLFAGSALLGLYLFRKLRRGRQVAEEMAALSGDA
jgi:uncharacterized membrane protein YdjX (TVP38/TMEM64 family)